MYCSLQLAQFKFFCTYCQEYQQPSWYLKSCLQMYLLYLTWTYLTLTSWRLKLSQLTGNWLCLVKKTGSVVYVDEWIVPPLFESSKHFYAHIISRRVVDMFFTRSQLFRLHNRFHYLLKTIPSALKSSSWKGYIRDKNDFVWHYRGMWPCPANSKCGIWFSSLI